MEQDQPQLQETRLSHIITIVQESIIAEFKPTILYIMEHTVTRKRYFGKTIRIRDEKYKGSGTYWINHIKKYGVQYVERIWVSEIFYCEQECKDFALAFSELFDIVNSNTWANQIVECGLDGKSSGGKLSDATRSKISKTLTGVPNPKSKYVIKESLEVRSKRLSDSNKNRIWINDGVKNKKVLKDELINYPDWKLGRLKINAYENKRKQKEAEYYRSPKYCSSCNKVIPFNKGQKAIYCNRSCRQSHLNKLRRN